MVNGALASLTPLQEFDNLVVNAMDLGGEVLVSELRSTVAAGCQGSTCYWTLHWATLAVAYYQFCPSTDCPR